MTHRRSQEFDKIVVGSQEEYDRVQANRRTVLDYDMDGESVSSIDDSAFTR